MSSSSSSANTMDWFSWLSKTALGSSLVYEYGVLFSHNELEAEDIRHFDHAFLQSMGISIAKHRLEILKLAKKDTSSSHQSLDRFLTALKKTQQLVAKYIASLLQPDSSSAIVVVPRAPSYGRRPVSGNSLKRAKRFVLARKGCMHVLHIDNGGRRPALQKVPKSVSSPVTPTALLMHWQSASPMIYRKGEEGNELWNNSSSSEEMIRWDTLFQDLKPT